MSNVVSLIYLVTHPDIDPELITNVLALEPSLTQKTGNPVVTPRKTLTGSHYAVSKWQYSHSLALTSDLREELRSLIDRLYGHAEFIKRIVDEGGRSLVYFSSTDSPHIALEIDVDILYKMAEMNVMFGFEFFSSA